MVDKYVSIKLDVNLLDHVDGLQENGLYGRMTTNDRGLRHDSGFTVQQHKAELYVCLRKKSFLKLPATY